MSSISFELKFPCFTILANDCTNPFVLVVRGENLAMVVFTSDERLRRYRGSATEASGPTVRFDSAEQLALYLDSLPGKVTKIAIDPDESGKAVVVDASDLYKKVLATNL